MGHSSFDPVETGPAWTAGRKLGSKRALKPKEIWAIRFMLDQASKLRDRALFVLSERNQFGRKQTVWIGSQQFKSPTFGA